MNSINLFKTKTFWMSLLWAIGVFVWNALFPDSPIPTDATVSISLILACIMRVVTKRPAHMVGEQ